MNHQFLPEAREEFAESALYYESKEVGLGVRFRDEVAHVIEHIVADPGRIPISGGNALMAVAG